jgi:anti-anti-sigma factor
MQLADLAIERRDRLVLATISGEIDLSNAADVRRRVTDALDSEDVGLVLDLTPTTFLDSAGLQVIFELQNVLREHRQDFHLVVPPDGQPWRTLDVVGVHRVAHVHGDRQAAIAAATASPPAPGPA